MFGQAVSKDSFILGIFAILTTGLCVATFAITKDQIDLNKKIALEKALFELVPKESHDNDMLADVQIVNDPRLGNKEPVAAYIARFKNEPVAAVFPVTAPEGYGGPINLLVGIYADESIAGVRVVPPHKETPGLGDKIDTKKSEWILVFAGKSLKNPKQNAWKVKKDGGEFDSFTGATITPRAVVNAVNQTLLYFHENKTKLFIKAQETITKNNETSIDKQETSIDKQETSIDKQETSIDKQGTTIQKQKTTIQKQETTIND